MRFREIRDYYFVNKEAHNEKLALPADTTSAIEDAIVPLVTLFLILTFACLSWSEDCVALRAYIIY